MAAIVRAAQRQQVRLLSSFWITRENLADHNATRAAAAANILQLVWACVLDTGALRTLANDLAAAGIPTADVPHLAAAQIGGAQYLVTADDSLQRRAARPAVGRLVTVQVLNPVDLQVRRII